MLSADDFPSSLSSLPSSHFSSWENLVPGLNEDQEVAVRRVKGNESSLSGMGGAPVREQEERRDFTPAPLQAPDLHSYGSNYYVWV